MKILHSIDKLTVEQFQSHLQIESETHVRDALIQAYSSTINNVSQKNLRNENKNKKLKVSKKSLDKKRKSMNKNSSK